MDNMNDVHITFDNNGLCSYCTEALLQKPIVYFPNETGKTKMEALITKLKKEGAGKEYDCMMGISGGLDSSYLAMLGSQWGLRILAVHIDDGFDSEVTKDNIRKLCNATNINLITIQPNREQYYGLIKAFIYAESPNLTTPQDNVLLATLHKYAKKNGIKYFLSGGNFALESILQPFSSSNTYDLKKIRYINTKYGSELIRELNLISNFQRVIDRYIYKLVTLRPLNYIDYNKAKAVDELSKKCGYVYYETKHCENYLTMLTQLYWLPMKFGYDKRKSHFSSLIVTDQLSREEAIANLKLTPYSRPNMKEEIENVLNRLEMNYNEFYSLLNKPSKLFINEPPTSLSYLMAKKYLKKFIIKFKG